MKAVCVSCFNYYDNRVKYVESFLQKSGYEVIYITSDFDHINKVNYNLPKINTILIHTKPYIKNISIKRLLSHYYFAKDVLRSIKQIEPDLLYVIIPPNLLAWISYKYKKRYKVKLIYDLYDLWPETLPMKSIKKYFPFPFAIWKSLRSNNLCHADMVIAECGLYLDILRQELNNLNTEKLYLTKEKSGITSKPVIDCNTIHLCYLGSINNIIDIPFIVELLNAINRLKNVKLHIIGDGESRELLIKEVKRCGIKVEYHGKVFDEEKKIHIFDKCAFGINIMQHTVAVGLTMKSIDYFEAGLPILNNIKGDTLEIVNRFGIGFNVSKENITMIAKEVAGINIKELLNMRKETKKVFDEIFSLEAFEKRLDGIIRKMDLI